MLPFFSFALLLAGVLSMKMRRARRGLPRQIKFGDTYPSLVGLSTTGWEMDREFLVELDKAAWDSVVMKEPGGKQD